MTSVQDIAEFIGDLETKPLHVAEERCMRVRNRNSACTACKDVCPEKNAIRFARNRLVVDFELCVGCTACTTVCPTEALVPLIPADDALAASIANAAVFLQEKTGSAEAVIACARAVSQETVDPRTFAEVPCLCRIDESLLFDLAAHGIPWASLIDGGCDTCRFRLTEQTTNATVESVNDALEALGGAMRVERVDAFPSFCLLKNKKEALASERRDFFNSFRADTRNVATEAAKRALHLDEPYVPILKRIHSQNGALPHFQVPRHEKVTASIDAIIVQNADAKPSGTAETRVYLQRSGNIIIDGDACNACGVCATFCPTAALIKHDKKDAKAQGADLLLDFSWDLCIGCGACVDVCPKKCIDLQHVIDMSLPGSANTQRRYFLSKH